VLCHHAVTGTGLGPPGCHGKARTVTSAHPASQTGVVRAIARSDHDRGVSKPSGAQLSAPGTSTDQRLTTQGRISRGVASRSVQHQASSRRVPSGSAPSTSRMATGSGLGGDPSAVRETTHSRIRWPSYPSTVTVSQGEPCVPPPLPAPWALPLPRVGTALARRLRAWRMIQGGRIAGASPCPPGV
jgi:hypothetical protein